MEAWAKTATDADKAILREKIRVSTLSRRAARRAKNNANATTLTAPAKRAYAALEPSDLLNKHAWLFKENWVEESADEIYDDEEIDFRKREERVRELRVEALREVHAQRGIEGFLELAKRGRAAGQIGWLAAQEVLSAAELKNLLVLAFEPILAGTDESFPERNLVAGTLRSQMDAEKRVAIISGITAKLSDDVAARVLLLAPFRKPTWILVDKLDEAGRALYWKKVIPDWIHDSDAENNEAVERLLTAQRPRAAFSCAHYHPEKLGEKLLYRLLTDVATGGGEPSGHYKLEEYSIEKAFKFIDSSHELTPDQKAGLEFAYLEVLARPWDSRESS